MTLAAKVWTAEELLELPADNMRHELVRGELTTRAPTSGEHGIRTFNIATILGAYIRSKDLGAGFGAETGFIVARNPDTVLAPDCAFVRKERIPAQGVPKGFWPGAPDLAVEVLSPSDSASDVLGKIDAWLEAGTRLVWVVDPKKKTVTVFAPKRQPMILKEKDVVEGEDLLPGFRLEVEEIFR
jgi:Uma2 family endonuclease